MGNPSVRFDEGWERVGHWPLAFQPILSRLLYNPNLTHKCLSHSMFPDQPREHTGATPECHRQHTVGAGRT